MNLIALTQTDASGGTTSRILINPLHIVSISGRFLVGKPDGAEIKLAVSGWVRPIIVTESVDTVAALLSDSPAPAKPGATWDKLDELLVEWEEFDGDVSHFYDKWVAILNGEQEG